VCLYTMNVSWVCLAARYVNPPASVPDRVSIGPEAWRRRPFATEDSQMSLIRHISHTRTRGGTNSVARADDAAEAGAHHAPVVV